MPVGTVRCPRPGLTRPEPDGSVTPVDVLDAVIRRRSIRAFQGKSLPEDAVERLIEAVLWAPSAGNLQSRFFYFVLDRKLRIRLARAALDQFFVSEAPLAVVACCDLRIEDRYGRRGRDLYTVQDVSAGIQNLLLVACALGLGAVWVGAIDEEETAEVVGAPPHLRPVAIVPVGYPAESPPPPPRVPRTDAVKVLR